jgi:hypothetical protein
MFKHKRLRYITIFMLLILSFTFATPTFACQFHFVSLEERVDTAPIVLIGTITDIVIVSPEDSLITMQVTVETYLQGEGLAAVTIEGYHNIHPCGENPSYDYPSLGGRIIFFVHGTGETLHTQYYDGWNSIYPAYEEILSDIVAYINDPFRPVYRLERQLEQSRYAAPFYYYSHEIAYRLRFLEPSTIAMFSLGLVDVLVVMFVVRHWWAYKQQPRTKRGNTDKG